MKKFTKKELKLIEEIKEKLIIEINKTDKEGAHFNADNLLCDLLNGLKLNGIVELWDKVGKWYS
jgi:hypothetical protein